MSKNDSNRGPFQRLPAIVILAMAFPGPSRGPSLRGPADLSLGFTSPFDGSIQPYRLYLPSAYDGSRPMPLLVALHGSAGDHNKYFDHKDYHCGIYKAQAEKRDIAVLCPLWRRSERIGPPSGVARGSCMSSPRWTT